MIPFVFHVQFAQKLKLLTYRLCIILYTLKRHVRTYIDFPKQMYLLTETDVHTYVIQSTVVELRMVSQKVYLQWLHLDIAETSLD